MYKFFKLMKDHYTNKTKLLGASGRIFALGYYFIIFWNIIQIYNSLAKFFFIYTTSINFNQCA